MHANNRLLHTWDHCLDTRHAAPERPRRSPASRPRPQSEAPSQASSPSAPITARNPPADASAGTRTRAASRTGCRDPGSQTFIESWAGQFKKQLARRAESEFPGQARKGTTTYTTSCQHRPHSGIGYQTPTYPAATPPRGPYTPEQLKPTTQHGPRSRPLR